MSASFTNFEIEHDGIKVIVKSESNTSNGAVNCYARMGRLKVGDRIIVRADNHPTLVYEVTEVQLKLVG